MFPLMRVLYEYSFLGAPAKPQHCFECEDFNRSPRCPSEHRGSPDKCRQSLIKVLPRPEDLGQLQ